jgi:hypothetical protein
MTSIEVPDWVVEAALLASFRVACEHTGKEFSDDEFRNARDEHDRENRNVASEMMKAAITAALVAWVVQVGVAEVKKLSERTSSYDIAPLDWSFYLSDGNHALYTLRQEKPE